MQKRGYDGCLTPVKKTVRSWRDEGRERAFVRFETAPGEQAWGHSGNCWRQAFVRICVDAGLVADAVRGVHAAAGHRDAAQLHGARLPFLWRGDGNRADRQHEDGGGGAHR
ncbi:MAG: hypothetical protein ACYCSP_09615 [Acidobacteriaceae bacterium]